MIEVKDLWWKYATGDWALSGIDLKVEKGEVLAITGASGAGKTTLCLCLNGLIPHSFQGEFRGEVRVAGLNTKDISPGKLSTQVGFVFQDPESQFLTMSVEDEIVWGIENLGLARSEIERRIDWVTEITRLEGLLTRPPYELSGGQKQRVAIASALAMKPEVLIMDEPTSELDPIGRQEVFAVIAELERQGMTIVLVEHHMEEVVKVADRLILIERGRIVRCAAPRPFFADLDFIKSRGVMPPQVTEVCQHLTPGRIALTIEEALPELAEIQLKLPGNDHSLKGFGGPAVAVEEVRFAYPDGFASLRGIDLTIREGEFLAIIGQNGSGKTTLVKHFNGLLKPTKGDILVMSQNTGKRSTAELAKIVGYVFQNPDHQICNETVYKEVCFGPQNLGLSKAEIEGRIDKSLAEVGLVNKKEEHPFFLSKAERQRLAVASVLAMEPPILIIDEPTTGQDARQSREIMELVRHLRDTGRTIVVITHDMKLVAEYCQRTVVMANGRILLDGATRQVFSAIDTLKQAYIEPPQVTLLGQALGFPGILTVEEFLSLAEAQS
ncbi:MAG: energy-coupling factor ABC transporter ATP-binding protein [Chloroflexi bacterium]|nr:energy-coupling factor ABC transporter ATP-binding protein [Chloroflexota bacterium]MCL5076140.1 energy-coupling factor ABC transporter ATP-binding protein [Chloroflexota bacterium]